MSPALLLVCASVLPCASRDRLLISEIHFAPADPSLEFVELINISAEGIVAQSLTLSDERAVPSPVPDTESSIPPNGRLVLVRNSSAFSAHWPGVPHVQVDPWPTLNNDGDESVIHSGGVELDRVSYSSGWGRAGYSLERIDPCGPSSHPVNWGASLDPSGATPGRTNSIYAPDRTPPVLRMADRIAPDRIAAVFDEPIDLSAAVFELDGRARSAYAADDSPSEASVAVDAADSDGLLVVRHVGDLFGNILGMAETNVAHVPRSGSLLVAEVLTRPSSKIAGQFAFVELVSASNRPQSLRGLVLQGPPDKYGLRIEAPVPFPAISMVTGDRVVLYDPEHRNQADSLFRNAFPSASSANLVQVTAWPLGSNPAQIRIAERDGTVVDEINIRGDWHDPVLGSAEGRSLERVDPLAHENGPAAWTTSVDPFGATPGSTNRAEERMRGRPPLPGDLRITEVHYEPDALQPEFIEVASVAEYPVDPNAVYLVNAPMGSSPDSVRLGYGPDALTAGDTMVLSWVLPSSDPWLVAADMARAFPGSDGRIPTSRIRPADGARSLRNDGASLILYAPDGTELDHADYSPNLHHPALRVTRGVSLQKIDWNGPSNEGTNWTSTTHPDGATPGFRSGSGYDSPPPGNGLDVIPRVFTPDGDELSRHTAIHIRMHDGPSVTDVRIFDLSGRLIRTLADGRLSNGPDIVYWDGLDDLGLPAPTNPYVVLVRTWNPDGRQRTGRSVVVLARR